MERLGIEEGEHIESGMVTRAVENAQKKVENLHYESRKHILEYDDIANEQRKVIYRYRNELLDPEYDISGKVKENRADYVADVLSRSDIYEGIPEDEYNIERLIALLREEVLIEFSEDDFKGLEAEALRDKLNSALTQMYEKKMSVTDAKQRDNIEKIVYLQVVDNSWREHLYQMDILKTGIGLRGYNQKDPLTEYKKESYEMFMDLIKRIKHESTKTLQLIQLRDESQEKEREEAMAKMMAEMEAAAENVELEHESVLEPKDNKPKIEKKIPRNDPCPCGSGKKYKNCCGKSGPKKGLLAK